MIKKKLGSVPADCSASPLTLSAAAELPSSSQGSCSVVGFLISCCFFVHDVIRHIVCYNCGNITVLICL